MQIIFLGQYMLNCHSNMDSEADRKHINELEYLTNSLWDKNNTLENDMHHLKRFKDDYKMSFQTLLTSLNTLSQATSHNIDEKVKMEVMMS